MIAGGSEDASLNPDLPGVPEEPADKGRGERAQGTKAQDAAKWGADTMKDSEVPHVLA